MSPSRNSAPSAGSSPTTPAPGFCALDAIESRCGDPKRAVPRVTTSVESTRLSAGTRIGDAGGDAVRAAISAGERMRDAAVQPASAESATTASSRTAARRASIAAPRAAPRPSAALPVGPRMLAGPR